MKARWRARVNASRQSRMILKTVTGLALRLIRREDAPERLLIVESPCQSDLKRVLRRSGLPPDTASTRRILSDLATSSVGMVNTGFRFPPHGFKLVDVRARQTNRRGRQSKIYLNSIPEEFCVNFSRIKRKAITCDLSRVARSDALRKSPWRD